jgi:ABC-2 type transport system permease protein
MNHILTLARLTFHEAWRRWMVIVALLLGLIFVGLYAFGFSMLINDLRSERPLPGPLMTAAYNFLVLAGLYVVHGLTVMLTIFASVDAVSGEITSHTIQTIVTKPVPRWQVLLGKYLGYAAMLLVYLGLLASGVLVATNLLVGYVPPNAVAGIGLILLEALVLLSLSLLGGTRLSTLTNGVALFMLYGLTFIGTWVQQIGAVLQSETAVRIGEVSSWVLPVEALWRQAAFVLQPPNVLPGNFVSPFGALATPNPSIVYYALIYAAVAVGLALFSFSRRDL